MKDIIIRASKTFVQGFLASLTITMSNGIDITNGKILASATVGALAAGLSAVMNLFLTMLNKKKEAK